LTRKIFFDFDALEKRIIGKFKQSIISVPEDTCTRLFLLIDLLIIFRYGDIVPKTW